MKRKFLSLLLAAAMSLNMAMPVFAAETNGSIPNDTSPDTITLESPDPDDDLSMQIWLEEGIPYYTVTLNEYEIVEKSKLGLNTRDIGSFENGFSMGEVQINNVVNEPWYPVIGEQESVEDKYQEAIIPLRNENGTLVVEARVYDTGVAFRYDLPKIPEGKEQYVIGSDDEKTQFAFPKGAYAYRHIGQNQTKPSRTSVDNLGSNIFRPMTVTYENGLALTICEGNLDNYAVLKLENDGSNPRTAKVKLGGDVTVCANEAYISNKHYTAPAGPEVSPWRTMVIGESLTDLAQNATLAQLLNEPADEETYQFSDWVEAGSCQRVMKGDNDDREVMNNPFIEKMVDQAAERGYRYVLLDTGWQGPENDPNCDPRLDPAKLEPDKYQSDKILKEQYFARPEEYENTFLKNGEGCFYTRGNGFKKYGSLGDGGDMQVDIDIPALCDYANKKGVGILLYVNGTRFFPDDMSGNGGRYRFTPDELFEYFERWGVAGVKPGFVECDSQNNELYMQEVVEAAARHHLVMTVHDKWVPSGIERTYPNLLSAEGIYGDEEKGNVTIPEDISTIFTRTIQGPADHTYCWPGKATKGYALASPLMFRTGLNLLFWYTNTLDIPDKDKGVIDFYDNLPSTWKQTLYLEGQMQGYATVARQSFEMTKTDGTKLPSRWYIGSLSAVDRTLTIPLDFLESGRYVAEIYYDGPDADPNAGFNSAAKKEQTLLKETYLVDESTTLVYDIKAKYGYSVRLTKASDYGDISSIPTYGKAALQSMLNAANALEAPYYETAAWNVLHQEAAKAQAVMDDVNASDEVINEAVSQLSDAVTNYRNTIPLLKVLASTRQLISGYYTKDSWMVLDEAMKSGKALLENPQASEEELTDAAQKMKSAIDGLQEDLLAEKEVADWLSDLDYDAQKSWNGDTYNPSTGEGNKMDKVCKDKNRAGGDMKLVFGSETKTYEKGLGMDAPGELYYDLTGKDYAFFEATVGIDAEKVGKSNGIIFQVYGDGQLLSETAIAGNKQPQDISVPISDIKELVIVTDPNGSSSHDWANWADARFTRLKNSEGKYEFVNVALGKPVEVTSIEKPENDKANVNDGNDASRWAASSNRYPQEVVVDLEQEYEVLQTVVNFYNKNGDRYYTYNIYTSNDKETWTLCADQSRNTTPGLKKDKMPENTKARYVKLEVTGSSNSGAYASVFEFQTFAAIKKEEVDKSDLEALIGYAKSQQKEADYKYLIPAVKTLFEKALADAVKVNNNPAATQEQVDAAYDTLLAKVHLLDFTGNTESLDVLVDAAKAKYQQEELYTKESWEPFAKAFDAAQKLLEDENALQAEIDATRDALKAAMEALVLKPIDTKKLEKLIDDSKKYEGNIDKYTSDSAKAFTAALEGARGVLEGDKLTQEAIDSAYTTLRNAIFGLREIPDKDKLGELLGKVKAMDLSVYSEETASAVKAAYAKATAVFEDENADQKKVDAAVAALEEAVASDNAGSKGTTNKTAGKSAAKTGDGANAAIPMTAGLVAILAAVIAWRKKTNRV